MEDRELRQLLARSAKGALTPAERQRLDQWYESHDLPGERGDGVFKNAQHEDAVRRRLLARILERLPSAPARKGNGLRRLRPVRWAAAVLLVCVSVVILYHRYGPEAVNVPSTEALQTSTAPTGKLLKVRLEDGSEILLNAGSSVSYPTRFAGETREVRLTGEAFFNVAPDSERAFVVKAGKMDVRVLGTSFNVRAHPEMDEAKVTVATGKVSVETEGKALSLLKPNQEMSFDQQTAHFAVADIDANLATSWQRGEIRLDGVSFQELAVVVKNTWGLTLETASDRLKEANYKTTFHVSNSIDDVMQVIGKIAGANYHIEDTKILLYDMNR